MASEAVQMDGKLSDEISQAFFDAKGPLLRNCNLPRPGAFVYQGARAEELVSVKRYTTCSGRLEECGATTMQDYIDGDCPRCNP